MFGGDRRVFGSRVGGRRRGDEEVVAERATRARTLVVYVGREELCSVAWRF